MVSSPVYPPASPGDTREGKPGKPDSKRNPPGSSTFCVQSLSIILFAFCRACPALVRVFSLRGSHLFFLPFAPSFRSQLVRVIHLHYVFHSTLHLPHHEYWLINPLPGVDLSSATKIIVVAWRPAILLRTSTSHLHLPSLTLPVHFCFTYHVSQDPLVQSVSAQPSEHMISFFLLHP